MRRRVELRTWEVTKVADMKYKSTKCSIVIINKGINQLQLVISGRTLQSVCARLFGLVFLLIYFVTICHRLVYIFSAPL